VEELCCSLGLYLLSHLGLCEQLLWFLQLLLQASLAEKRSLQLAASLALLKSVPGALTLLVVLQGGLL
jgi:hypothetical protein